MRQLYYTEEESFPSRTQTTEVAQGNLSFQEQRERDPLLRTLEDDFSASERQEMAVAAIKEENKSTEEIQMMERMRVLQLQAEQMAEKNRQRQLEESKLAESIKVMDQRKRDSIQEKEKQRKILHIKQETEKLEQLLQRQHEEEIQRMQRIDILQQKEALMRKEMEEADRQFAISIEKGARPKVYDELQSRTKKVEVDAHPNSERQENAEPQQEGLYRRDTAEKSLFTEGNTLKKQLSLHKGGADSDRIQSSVKQEELKIAEIDRDKKTLQ